MITNHGAFCIADTHVRHDPTAAEIAENALLCAVHMRRFGLSRKSPWFRIPISAPTMHLRRCKMRQALELIRESAPDLEVDGEMQADTALSQEVRDRVLPGSRLKGAANVLIMPDLPAANIAYQMTKMLADALPIGPILLGAARPVHILTPSITARGIANMTAVAVAEAQQHDEEPDMA